MKISHELTCDQARQMISQPLTKVEDQLLRGHLESCTNCLEVAEHLTHEMDSIDWPRQLTMDALDFELSAHDELNVNDFAVDFLAPPNDPTALGSLGGYDIHSIIGRGGMGFVMRAYDPDLKRYVAIKALNPSLASNPVARKRFTREAQAAAAVAHLNVIAIHRVHPSGKLPFLVMPLVSGESLADRLKREGSLDLAEILRIGMQTASGLAAAHDQGLVHRDIKPSNILLEFGVERAVLTDFGLARAVDDVSLTRTNSITGTPEYMSPEAARGEWVDARSDLFSLGSVLYTMAAGVSPFRADTTIAALRNVSECQPRPLVAVQSNLPVWFTNVVDRLLEKNPSDRIQTAKELEQLLEQGLAHLQRPRETPAPVVAPATTKSHARIKSIRLFLPIILTTLLTGLIGWNLFQWMTTEQRPDISGQWVSPELGTIQLTQTSPGNYIGQYSEPASTPPVESTIHLHWTPAKKVFYGTWTQGKQRFGDLVVRTEGADLRGAWTVSERAPGYRADHDQLSDLHWTRPAAPRKDLATHQPDQPTSAINPPSTPSAAREPLALNRPAQPTPLPGESYKNPTDTAVVPSQRTVNGAWEEWKRNGYTPSNPFLQPQTFQAGPQRLSVLATSNSESTQALLLLAKDLFDLPGFQIEILKESEIIPVPQAVVTFDLPVTDNVLQAVSRLASVYENTNDKSTISGPRQQLVKNLKQLIEANGRFGSWARVQDARAQRSTPAVTPNYVELGLATPAELLAAYSILSSIEKHFGATLSQPSEDNPRHRVILEAYELSLRFVSASVLSDTETLHALQNELLVKLNEIEKQTNPVIPDPVIPIRSYLDPSLLKQDISSSQSGNLVAEEAFPMGRRDAQRVLLGLQALLKSFEIADDALLVRDGKFVYAPSNPNATTDVQRKIASIVSHLLDGSLPHGSIARWQGQLTLIRLLTSRLEPPATTPNAQQSALPGEIDRVDRAELQEPSLADKKLATTSRANTKIVIQQLANVSVDTAREHVDDISAIFGVSFPKISLMPGQPLTTLRIEFTSTENVQDLDNLLRLIDAVHEPSESARTTNRAMNISALRNQVLDYLSKHVERETVAILARRIKTAQPPELFNLQLLEQQRTNAQVDLNNASLKLGANHPKIIELQRTLKSLEELLELAVQKAASSEYLSMNDKIRKAVELEIADHDKALDNDQRVTHYGLRYRPANLVTRQMKTFEQLFWKPSESSIAIDAPRNSIAIPLDERFLLRNAILAVVDQETAEESLEPWRDRIKLIHMLRLLNSRVTVF